MCTDLHSGRTVGEPPTHLFANQPFSGQHLARQHGKVGLLNHTQAGEQLCQGAAIHVLHDHYDAAALKVRLQ